MCKYFPACLDGEECFFSHDKSNERRNEESSPFCPRGTKCSDQSCNYSEANHANTDEIECKFQEKCTRKFCAFKHVVERRAFLEEGRLNRKRT